MSSKHIVWQRLLILFFTLLGLALAILNWANAYFAMLLRGRARSDYINTSNGIRDGAFEKLQSKVHDYAFSIASVSTVFVLYGIALAAHPRWLRNHDGLAPIFAAIQFLLAIAALVTGARIADSVHGFQTSFEAFGAHDKIPYYSMMYYGGLAQAIYGSLLLVLAITIAVVVYAVDHYKTKHYWDQQARTKMAEALAALRSR